MPALCRYPLSLNILHLTCRATLPCSHSNSFSSSLPSPPSHHFSFSPSTTLPGMTAPAHTSLYALGHHFCGSSPGFQASRRDMAWQTCAHPTLLLPHTTTTLLPRHHSAPTTYTLLPSPTILLPCIQLTTSPPYCLPLLFYPACLPTSLVA